MRGPDRAWLYEFARERLEATKDWPAELRAEYLRALGPLLPSASPPISPEFAKALRAVKEAK